MRLALVRVGRYASQIVTTQTASVDPKALRYAREEKRLSQRELGRRVATRLGRAEATRALQVRLGRLEKGDAISEEDRDLVDAVAAELAIGADDLAEPPVWGWIRLAGDRPGIVELAMRMPYWTSPEAAYEARDWLAHTSGGHLTPFKDAQLLPFRVPTIDDILDENYPDLTGSERQALIAVDLNSDDRLGYLAALNLYMNHPDDMPFGIALSALGENGEKGLDVHMSRALGELEQIHELAMRRLVQAPREYPELVASWRLREQRLYDLLEETFEMRRKWRAEMIGLAPAPPSEP